MAQTEVEVEEKSRLGGGFMAEITGSKNHVKAFFNCDEYGSLDNNMKSIWISNWLSNAELFMLKCRYAGIDSKLIQWQDNQEMEQKVPIAWDPESGTLN